MNAGAVTVLGGLTVIGTVTALYFWPSSVGERCPVLDATVDEVAASTDREHLEAVRDVAERRNGCLMMDLNEVIAPRLPEAFGIAETLIRAPFEQNDIRRWDELQREALAVRDAAELRLDELEAAPAEAASGQ